MNKEQCKAFRDAGLLDALIEGRLQYLSMSTGWIDVDVIYAGDSIEYYRIKPEKKSHNLESAIKAVAENGMTLYGNGTDVYHIVSLGRDNIVLKDNFNHLHYPPWKDTMYFKFNNGVGFYREE